MKEDLIIRLLGFIFGILIFILGINYINKKEQIKQLEQQIQEKQVYINILERKENEVSLLF